MNVCGIEIWIQPNLVLDWLGRSKVENNGESGMPTDFQLGQMSRLCYCSGIQKFQEGTGVRRMKN